jgi:DNA mismatch repair protein MutL
VFAAVERAVRGALAAGTRLAPSAPMARSDRVREAAEAYLAGGSAHERPALELGDRQAPASTGSASALLGGEAPTLLGQHRNTYIVASDGEALLLVDQHTAHERVRFEALLARLEKRATVESQLLLGPVVVQLEPRLLPILDANVEHLRELGYDVEPFGGGALRLAAVPALLGGREPGVSLAAILRDLLEREASEWAVASGRERLAASLACHSAVRAGQALNAETMRAIVTDLGRTEHPTLCPHGRPTSVRIPRDDLSRWFGRSGWSRQ